MASKRENTYDLVIKYVILLFAIALMVLLIYSVLAIEDIGNKLLGVGISFSGIIGTIMIGIFKNELDKSINSNERKTLIDNLMGIFRLIKNENRSGKT